MIIFSQLTIQVLISLHLILPIRVVNYQLLLLATVATIDNTANSKQQRLDHRLQAIIIVHSIISNNSDSIIDSHRLLDQRAIITMSNLLYRLMVMLKTRDSKLILVLELEVVVAEHITITITIRNIIPSSPNIIASHIKDIVLHLHLLHTVVGSSSNMIDHILLLNLLDNMAASLLSLSYIS